MNIIFIGKRGRQTKSVKLKAPSVLASSLLALLLFPTLMFYGGYFVAQQDGPGQDKALMAAWQDEMVVQREEVAAARRKVDEDMDALALRLGELQAKVIRLDALGERLTEMAKLDKGEFDFSKEPAVGGPENASAVESMAVPDFVQSLDGLSQQLDDRAEQLGLLEEMIMSRNLEEEVRPAGRPITKGWTSSYYGMRTDPFTGRREHHKGMDFAGKQGSDIVSVGAGVVTWAGDRYGYGNLVEINHGNGYSTRYGHCEEILVSVGDTVTKGQVLALMGSTGRSTGPHVHFEVRYKGKTVDPKKYTLASR
jgi:murein DD-endopeptidase MepM/ murein hydrolase activator NlpD